MGHRFEFETPGFWKHILILIMDVLDKKTTPVEYIHDKQTGQRFILSEEESALLLFFGSRLDKYVALKKDVRTELVNRTFDAVSFAFLSSRTGDDATYHEMLAWQESDWDKWIASVLEGIRI